MTDEELLLRLRLEDTSLTDLAADRIEALTKERDQHWDSFVHWRKEADARSEQLAAARRDAEIAEEELELQEEEACMMENSYFELEKELNTCRMAQAVMDNTVADLEAKLAKAVEGQKVNALEQILEERGAVFDAMVDAAEDAAGKDVSFNVVVGRALRAALAEIKGESHD